MSFNYPIGYVFKAYDKIYYTYMGYNKEIRNPYSFKVTDPSFSSFIHRYTNEHSKIWTESAVERGYIIPLLIMPPRLLVDICEYKRNAIILSKIIKVREIPDEIENLIRNYLGFHYLCNYIPKDKYLNNLPFPIRRIEEKAKYENEKAKKNTKKTKNKK